MQESGGPGKRIRGRRLPELRRPIETEGKRYRRCDQVCDGRGKDESGETEEAVQQEQDRQVYDTLLHKSGKGRINKFKGCVFQHSPFQEYG